MIASFPDNVGEVIHRRQHMLLSVVGVMTRDQKTEPTQKSDRFSKTVNIDKTAQNQYKIRFLKFGEKTENRKVFVKKLSCFPIFSLVFVRIFEAFKCIVYFTYLICLCKNQDKNNDI
jgi:hypothetical protein